MAEERSRLKADAEQVTPLWKKWGPYLSERQWATVREDYSEDGTCWEYFPHDDARSRAYRWGEDGLLGITDNECRLCLALCLWNEKDPILKERLFGLTGNEGNHGEDVKELYYYLDSLPSHSYMAGLYKYPHKAYPYDNIVAENKGRSKQEPEYELLDTGVFDDGEYWDVKAEVCKKSPEDILVRYTISNRGQYSSRIHVLPTLWFRNTWSWGKRFDAHVDKKPHLKQMKPDTVEVKHLTLGSYTWQLGVDQNGSLPNVLFTENETNTERLYDIENNTPYVKDAFHRLLLFGEESAVNPAKEGTKCAAHYVLNIARGEEFVIKVRLREKCLEVREEDVFSGATFDETFLWRHKEADKFYDEVIVCKDPQEYLVTRQAYAGLLWSKQFYYYVVDEWLEGHQSETCANVAMLRNSEWRHLYNKDIISMPDKWEYPWYASWDLAFHMIPFASIDLDFCKHQIPAYEFALSDVNPPVLAYAVLKIYKASGDSRETRDQTFLARCFHKLSLNFTWWVNRKDPDGLNIFQGGFLGLDNIGVFDRSKPLPTGGRLAQKHT